MIQIYADGALVYDSRVEEYDLIGLTITTGLNKGGTAEITMPKSHPAYSSFTPYRTIVEIHRDGDVRFRGRALYPTDDFDNNRTITCEGELCFLQDYVRGPYKTTTTPKAMFTALIAEYNEAMEEWKRFTLGALFGISDTREYDFESEEAETALDTINKLLELCGGYIVFGTNTSGARVIDWIKTTGSNSTQTIDAGENLFDFGRTYANTELCTVVLPYGAKNTTTGERLTIASINNGKPTITSAAAVALRGTIMKAVVWDEVTNVYELEELARSYLDNHTNLIESMTISALDLTYAENTVDLATEQLDSFKLGDMIRVVSKAHSLDERFQLTEMTENLLNPEQSLITLGKETKTLTALSVEGDNSAMRGAQRAASHSTTANKSISGLSTSITDLTARVLALENPE